MSTTLNCIQWMVNQEDETPCVTAQAIGQFCDHGYTVSLIDFQESNYVPNATTANGCACSWSIYNLLSACAYCVGQRQYTSWSAWIASCGSYASNTSYLPSGLSISQGIPYWAATNPSTWANATFNVTQAANIAEEDHSDVTGEPLSTSTATTSSSSNVPVGMIVGLVIGGFAIMIIGGLTILCAVYRRRRRGMNTAPNPVSSFNTFKPVVVPPVQPTPTGYAHASPAISPYFASPVHSTTSLAPTSFVSPVSSGFSSNGRNAWPITDAADMISPFLVTSSSHQTNRTNTSMLTGKGAEVLSERVIARPGQRARLNPPPYSATMEPGSPGSATASPRRLSTRKPKRRNSSVASGATTYSGHSRTSMRETAHTGTQAEQSRPYTSSLRLGTAQSTQSTMSTGGVGSIDDGGNVETMHSSRRVDRHPPVV